ncbi:Stp1/IreP family PP2C-type Ser/Thr phosphatase [Scatolibacter rhodanostii]|uniref:Stp1/IreP family PP2C-type Ser/Thr phosphatase n=1 Tax=Scatolibacter rhodanostii TaxID=2014781 RepID=UPI000C06CB4F|nr:Stp1/IreP family PP2C-type Ser/Thr phosphatase [Scatolibacter rhodanostii]
MKVECGTDIGTVRQSNQDACACGALQENLVWGIVCDGMGGVSGGSVASSLALKSIRDELENLSEKANKPKDMRAFLNAAVQKANHAVYKTSVEMPELAGMGTTAVILVVDKHTLHTVHVGDSRAYLKSGDKLIKLTKDHSYVQSLVDLGQITQEEARVHPKRNIITRAIGVKDDVECDYSSHTIKEGDCVIACTDGLTNYVDDDTLSTYINDYKDGGLIQKLIDYAVEAGGADNISATVIFA